MPTARRELHELNHEYLHRLVQRVEHNVRNAASHGKFMYVMRSLHQDYSDPELVSILQATFPDCVVKCEPGTLTVSWD